MFVLGTRFGGVITQDEQEVPLNAISQHVTNQELQRYENQRFKVELEAEMLRKPLGRPRKSMFVGDSEISSSHSPEPSAPLLKKPRGRPRKHELLNDSTSVGSGRVKGPSGRPRKTVTFSKEPSVDTLHQPRRAVEEIRHSITVQIPSRVKARVKAMHLASPSTQPSVISKFKDLRDSSTSAEENFYDELGDEGTILRKFQTNNTSKSTRPMHSVVRSASELTADPSDMPISPLDSRNVTQSSSHSPLISNPKPLHRASASEPHPLQREFISYLKHVPGNSASKPLNVDSAFSDCEENRRSSQSKNQRVEIQSNGIHGGRDIRMAENKSLKDHTLSRPPREESRSNNFLSETENEDFNGDFKEVLLKGDLETQLKSSEDEDPDDVVSLLQQFQAPITLARARIPSPHIQSPSLSLRPAPSPQKTSELQMQAKSSGENHYQQSACVIDTEFVENKARPYLTKDRDPQSQNMDLDEESPEDALALLQQFQTPISPLRTKSLPSSHSLPPAPSPWKAPTLVVSPKRPGSISMTPHYPPRKSFAIALGGKDRTNEGKGRKRKRKRAGKVAAWKGGREESMEL